MLARWTLTNFKSFNSNNEFALAALTLLCGANSTGKSSILQSVLLIRQPLEHSPAEYVIALARLIREAWRIRPRSRSRALALGF